MSALLEVFCVLPRFLCYCHAIQTFYYLFPLLSILQQHPWAGPFLEMGLCGITLTSNLHLIMAHTIPFFSFFRCSLVLYAVTTLGGASAVMSLCGNDSALSWQELTDIARLVLANCKMGGNLEVLLLPPTWWVTWQRMLLQVMFTIRWSHLCSLSNWNCCQVTWKTVGNFENFDVLLPSPT